MQPGDRVKLLFDAGDLRYPIAVGAVGTITGGPYQDNESSKPWFWVEWYEDEAAMRMWEDELEVTDELSNRSG